MSQRPAGASAQVAQGDGTTPQEPAKPETIPVPEHTGWSSLFHSTMSDFAAFPRRKSTWVILGIGAGAAALAYPFDDEINESLQDADALDKAVTIRKLFDGKPLVSGVKALLAHIHGDAALAQVKPPLAAFSASDRAAVIAGHDAVRAKQVA